jgi:tRNA 2-thiouridine synthesizing protein A
MTDTTLDTSGLACPLPVLKAKKAMAGLAPGQVLRVISTDPGSVADFETFCLVTGNTLLEHSQAEGVFSFRIARGSTATSDAAGRN